MNKKLCDRIFLLLGLCVFFALCLVPGAPAQTGTPVSYAAAPAQVALSWIFNANSNATGGFAVSGLRYWQLLFVPSGTVSTCGVSFDSSTGSGFSIGGIISSGTIGSCATATTYSNSSPTTPTLLGQITPTITGSGSVTVVLLGYVNNPSASASTSIGSPVDGSGYVEVNCKTGCAGGNVNGQATMANSAPVVIASNQSALSVSNAPSLFAGAVIAGQQAVTATAAALPTTTLSRPVCIVAPITNTITIYLGPSGVTTSTGFPLPAGASLCNVPLSNLNQMFVVASTTGAAVAWSAQ